MPEPGPADRRIIPSNPLPASQKPQRRRYHPKAKAGPETSAINVDHVGLSITASPSLDAPEAEGPSVPSELDSKISPIDLINKRLKATSKKIARITSYASTNPRYLNADQKRFLKTLPTLEAIQKELSEVKKAIEEGDAADELIAENLEEENARSADTVAAVQVDVVPQTRFVTRTMDLLNVLRYSLLTSGKLDVLSIDEAEESIVYGVAGALLGTDDDKRRATVEGFLQESGDFDGISYTLLVDIAKAGLALPHIPIPPPAEETQEKAIIEPETAADVIIPGVPRGLPKRKGMNFVQESEIEGFGISGATRSVHVRTELTEDLQRKPEEDGVVAEAKKKKSKEEQRKRDAEQKWPEEWRLVDQLKRDKAEARQKRREEEQRKQEEQRKREEAQKWPDQWRLVDQNRAEKTATWKSRVEREPSSSGVTSWTALEAQTWDNDESMIWPSLISPVRRDVTWAAGPTRWNELEALSGTGEVKTPEIGKSFAQVARRGEWY